MKNYAISITGELPSVVRETADQIAASTPDDVSKVMTTESRLAQEAFFVLTLDTKNQILGKHMITLGLVDASLVHPREVFRTAIIDNASAIILAHNHPTGNTAPSSDDIRITNKLVSAGEVVDIKVLDHVIIAWDGTKTTANSLREPGVVSFK